MNIDDVQQIINNTVKPTLEKKVAGVHIFEVVCSQGGVRAVHVTHKRTHKEVPTDPIG